MTILNNCKKIMIAAPKSGSGKTMITCGILSALKARGLNVSSIKCGPDYIDPMFHKSVLGIDSNNLDTFFTDDEITNKLFYDFTRDCDICVTEGVMGLFDGVGGVHETGSSYSLASACDIPIILVVDAKGTSRSIIPTILGFLAYDTKKLIRGIIINNMSKMLFSKLKPIFDEEIPAPVIGFMEKNDEISIESRHLGLKLPTEIQGIRERLYKCGEILEKSIDINLLLEIAEASSKEGEEGNGYLQEILPAINFHDKPPVIAVAKDEAFCFYYDINIKILERLGAKIEYFSPLYDSEIPENASALYFGGGYPELYAKRLSENTSMLSSVKNAVDLKMPSIAECGGFMYLHSSLEDENRSVFQLVGAVDGCVFFTGKAQRFGYANFREKNNFFLKNNKGINGHEFHYYDSSNVGDAVVARKPMSKLSWNCNHVGEEYWWGFSHLYFPSNLKFPKRFVELARNYNNKHYC